MLIDMFTYTDVTEGCELDIDALIEAAKAAGLDGIVVTDSDYSAHAEEIQDAAEGQDLFVAVGVEIELQNGRVACLTPEIDGFLVDEEWRELTEFGFPTGQEVIDLVDKFGGVVIARDVYTKGNVPSIGDTVFGLNGLAAVDVLSPSRPRLQNELALEAALSLHKPAVAGSGAKKSADEVGSVATIFASELTTQADLVAALRAGDGWAVALSEMAGSLPTGTAPRQRSEGGDRGGRGGDRGGRGGDRGGRGGRGGDRGGRGGRGGDRGGRGGDRGGRGGDRGGRGGRDGGGRRRRSKPPSE